MDELSVRMRCPDCGARVDVKVSDLTPGSVRRCVCCIGMLQQRRGEHGQVEQAVTDPARSLEELSRALAVEG